MATQHSLYHYCSTNTGFSILENRTIRLSPLSAANDSLEGRVVGKVFNQLLNQTSLPYNVVEVISALVESYPEATEGFAFCLSEEQDLLSQWRAYANDGTGISIGFNPEVLSSDFGQVNLGQQYYEMQQVEYGEESLLERLKPFVEQVHDLCSKLGDFVKFRTGYSKADFINHFGDRNFDNSGVIESRDDEAKQHVTELLSILQPLHFLIYNTKDSSFREEKEWRLLRYRHRVAHPEIKYFANSSSIRPYIPCLIADPAVKCISEVVLGPKNLSNIDWVRAFLASVGLSHVRVRKSSIISYR